MRSEFEKWFDGEYSNYGVGYKKYYKNETDSYVSDFVDDRYSAFQAGHQHQQFKVDELQKRINACNTLINRWNKEADYADLIAQEDFVQNTLQGCINELEQTLKGGGE